MAGVTYWRSHSFGQFTFEQPCSGNDTAPEVLTARKSYSVHSEA